MNFFKIIIKFVYIIIFFFKKICRLLKKFFNFFGYISINPLETKSDFFFTRDFFKYYYVPAAYFINQLLIFLSDDYSWGKNKIFFFFHSQMYYYSWVIAVDLLVNNIWFFFLKTIDFLDYEWDIWDTKFLPMFFFKIFIELPLELELMFGEIFYVYFIPFYRSFEFIDEEDNHEAMNARSQREK